MFFEGRYKIREGKVLVEFEDNIHRNLELVVSIDDAQQFTLSFMEDNKEIILHTNGELHFNWTKLTSIKPKVYMDNRKEILGKVTLWNTTYDILFLRTVDGGVKEKIIFSKNWWEAKSFYAIRPKSTADNPIYKEQTISVFNNQYLVIYVENEWGQDSYLRFFDEKLELVEEYHIQSKGINMDFEKEKVTYIEYKTFNKGKELYYQVIEYEIRIENDTIQRNVIFQSEPELIIT